MFLVFTVLFYLLWQFFGLNSKFFFSFWEPKCFISSVAVTAKVTFNWQGFQQMDHGIARGCCVFIYCIICQSVLYVKLTLLCIVSYLALDSRDTNTKHVPIQLTVNRLFTVLTTSHSSVCLTMLFQWIFPIIDLSNYWSFCLWFYSR